MDLKTATADKNNYFLFEQSLGIERFIVYVGVYPKGIVIVDPYWTIPGSHPFHVVPGEVSGDESWLIDGHRLRLINDINRYDEGPMYLEYLASPDSEYETRERAELAADRTWEEYRKSPSSR